jgi:cell division protein FtsL
MVQKIARGMAQRSSERVTAPKLYRMFERGRGEAPSVRTTILVLVILACAITSVGVVRVARQHEVLRLGYALSRESDHVRALKEAERRLAVERATLTAPDRIRKLAVELGMTTVPPDRIRIIDVPPPPPKVALQ